jgi:glucosamine kinase
VAYYLGIDGGGSKTSCAVGDESSLLATVTAGPSNITRVGVSSAREALHRVIHDACLAANVDPKQLKQACIGIAGAGREETAAAVRNIVKEVLRCEIEVVGDMQIAVAAAFGGGPGVIVIAGTGSIASGRNASGETARAGGWGFAISDEGSAHWIGRTAVSAVLRALDETAGPGKNAQIIADELPLFRAFTAAWKVHSLDEFVRTANAGPDFSLLFPAVLDAAHARDPLAEAVLRQAGEELTRLAGMVARHLFGDVKASPIEIPVAMVGGVFRHSALVRGVFENGLRTVDSRLRLTPQVIEPVIGALQMARER